MPWKRMEVQQQRVEFVVRALREKRPLTELCRELGISRPTGYLWLKRYREGGVAAIEEQSRRPHHSPSQTAAEFETRILALREIYPDWGARNPTSCGRWTSRGRRTGPRPRPPCP